MKFTSYMTHKLTHGCMMSKDNAVSWESFEVCLSVKEYNCWNINKKGLYRNIWIFSRGNY